MSALCFDWISSRDFRISVTSTRSESRSLTRASKRSLDRRASRIGDLDLESSVSFSRHSSSIELTSASPPFAASSDSWALVVSCHQTLVLTERNQVDRSTTWSSVGLFVSSSELFTSAVSGRAVVLFFFLFLDFPPVQEFWLEIKMLPKNEERRDHDIFFHLPSGIFSFDSPRWGSAILASKVVNVLRATGWRAGHGCQHHSLARSDACPRRCPEVPLTINLTVVSWHTIWGLAAFNVHLNWSTFHPF